MEFLNKIQIRDAFAEPKHYVFLACPRRIMLTDIAVAKCFADIIQPSNPDTFLCHWVNEEYLKHFAWKEKTVSPWEDSPKLIMLLTRLETARLGDWCQQQNVSQAPGFEAYTPRLVREFQEMAEAKYGITGGNRALYLGLGILSCEVGGDRYKWPQHFLGCPQESSLVPSNTGLSSAQQAQGQVISGNLQSDMTNLRNGLPSPSAALPRELNFNIHGQTFTASPPGQLVVIDRARGLKREKDEMEAGVKAEPGCNAAHGPTHKRRQM
ncbi:hypothetical protein CaCOL14_009265 [Colletotrichum acutatum]